MLQVQTTEVAGWWIQVLAEREGEREIGDLVRWVGDVGRVCDYVPGQPGSYGRGKLGDEREPGKVGGFGELAGLLEYRQTIIKHWLYRAQTHSRGSQCI